MQNITSLIAGAIHALYDVEFVPTLSVAPKSELGEYCTNVFPLAKSVGKAPNIIAGEVASELAKHTDIFVSTSATGGYVNFFLTDTVWLDIFSSANTEPIEKNNETIIVDYIGANIGKTLHIGHICTPSIGQTILNIYKYLGYTAIGDVHTGDWGGIFGKLIVGYKIGKILTDEDTTTLEKRLGDNIDSVLINSYLHLANLFIQGRGYTDPSEQGIKDALERFSGTYYKGLSDNYETNPDKYIQYVNDQYIVLTYIAENDKVVDDLWRSEFKRLTEGDRNNQHIWAAQTKTSLQMMQKVLDITHVKYDVAIGEAFYEGLNLPKIGIYPDLEYTMKDIVVELVKKGIATKNEEDGSVGVVFESWQKMGDIFDEKTWEKVIKLPSNMLQKRDGTHGYFASDLACIKYRMTNGWNPSKIIYCTDIRQELHFKQVFAVAKMAGWLSNSNVELIHAPNGFISLPDGAMSTRTGKVISLTSLISEGFLRTKSILESKGRTLPEKDIQEIAIGAIKYSYLMQDRERNIVFDWDKALSFEGNSGPYIQYAYVRAKKISEAGDINHPELAKDPGNQKHGFFVPQNDISLDLSTYDKSLIQILARMDEVIHETAEKYKPHILALYCYDVAVTFNSFYVHTPKILEESDEHLKNFRLALVEKTTETLKLGFSLLGIEMPSEM